MREVVDIAIRAELEGLGEIRRRLEGAFRGLDTNLSRSLGQLLDLERSIADAIQEGARRSSGNVEKTLSQTLLGAWDKAGSKMSTTLARSMDVAIAGLRSPKQALESIISGPLKAAEDIGNRISKSMSQKGKGLMDDRNSTRMQKLWGGMLQAMGPLVNIMSTFVGSIGKLVSLLFDAEAQAKDLNKTLLDGGVAGGDLASSASDVRHELEGLRDAAVDFRNNMRWGTAAKDQLEILSAYNEAGHTLREMKNHTRDNSSAMAEYQDVTKVALTYSKLLGQSTREIATQHVQYMESLGGSLSYVEGQFNAVYKTAQLSGFGVKRFYSMVQQATSGLSMYNVRLDEAAGLLLRLGKILSAPVAADFIQTLNKGLAGEGMTERFKRIMTTGAGLMKDIFENSAEDIAFDFGQKLAKSGVGDQIAAEFSKAGISVDFGTEKGRKEVIKQLARMNPDEQASLLANIRKTDDGLARELSKLVKVSVGTKGGVENMASAMGGLDMGGVLAANLNKAMAVFGKPLYKLNAMELAAFENATGISGDQLELLREVDMGLRGQFQELEKRSQDLKDAIKRGDEEAVKKLLPTQEEQAKMMETWGASIDAQGNIFTASLKEAKDGKKYIVEGTQQAINDQMEYIQSQGDAIARATEVGIDENIALAQEIARNTTEVSKILEMGVQYWLEQIYKVVAGIGADLLGFADPQEVQQTLNSIDKTMSGLQEKNIDINKDLTSLQAELKTKTGKDKDVVQAKITAKEEELRQNEMQMRLQENYRQQVQGSIFSDDFSATREYDQKSVLGTIDDVYGKEKGKEIREAVDAAVSKMSARASELGSELSSEEIKKIRTGVYERMGRGLSTGEDLDSLVKSASDPSFLASDISSVRNPGEASADFSSFSDFVSSGSLSDGFLRLIDPMNHHVGVPSEGMQRALNNRNAIVANSRANDVSSRISAEVSGQSRGVGVAGYAQSKYGKSLHQLSGQERSEMMEGLGLTQDQLDILTRVSEQGLTEKAFQDLSTKELQELSQIKGVLPDQAQREREAKKAAELNAEIMTRADIQRQLNEVFGGEVPAHLIDEVKRRGFQNVPMDVIPEEYQAAYRDAFSVSGPVAQDFVYRPGRPPMSFSDSDTVVGMKAGGAIDKVLGKGDKRPVVINVYGSQAEIVNTVKRVLNLYG